MSILFTVGIPVVLIVHCYLGVPCDFSFFTCEQILSKKKFGQRTSDYLLHAFVLNPMTQIRQ